LDRLKVVAKVSALTGAVALLYYYYPSIVQWSKQFIATEGPDAVFVNPIIEEFLNEFINNNRSCSKDLRTIRCDAININWELKLSLILGFRKYLNVNSSPFDTFLVPNQKYQVEKIATFDSKFFKFTVVLNTGWLSYSLDGNVVEVPGL
jgi:hypothetical protein